MKVKTLLWNKVARMTLFALLLIVTGTMKAIANNDNHDDDAILRANYDFSSVCETGQTLYYKITNPALRQDLGMMRSQLVKRLNETVSSLIITDIRLY